ncbi:hypothetical protein DC366_09355 [Pelagivirga sediminicola]|uniref:DUF4139 domain-containing protein n=1 Tax=Pelagivirga sediminicola TaxID=2170575 RepID=A0A2T7G7V0_9RHOB|nr:DUF4139 domain-containing protein [Pelagivirga sediminicola]PVA10512.1 hypothetical protein DC366_09355 [Pelagivirga sediminicola]
MRPLPLLFALAVPTALWAEDIPLTSRVAEVTLYPQGATVRREVAFTAPAGQHDLILLDLPQNTDLGSVRVSVSGAQMGGVTTRRDFVPPRGDRTSAAVEAAEAEVERREDALRAARDDIARMRLAIDAADAQVAFLSQLGQGEGIAAQDVASLRDMAQMIGAQTLAARQAAHDAKAKADAAARDLEDLEKALEEARRALAALVPEAEDRAMLAVSISTQAQTDGTASITYQTHDAGWSPAYDMSLTRDTGALRIERGAYLRQNTGENWTDVALTLSTVRPSGQTMPSDLGPLLRRITDPVPVMRKQAEGALQRSLGDMMIAEDAAAPAPIMAEAEFDGLAVTYSYAPPATVASGADALRIALGTLETQARIEARAVPLYDETAFLIAELTNDMDELILPGQTNLYLDETYVGQIYGDLIAAGAEAELPFGPIEGLRLTRKVPDREEGDRGLIRKSSDLTETAVIEIENLTGEAWPLRVLDRVPYSEQEDLQIQWQADPQPAEVDVDGARGVLAWDLQLEPGASQTITLRHDMQWPEDKVLQ